MKIGILCDTYKVDMFKQELTKANIEFTIDTMGANFSIITCNGEQSVIGPINDKVTLYFNNINNNQNSN